MKKIDQARIHARLTRIIEEQTIIVLINPGNKQSQVKDIQKAKEYWNDYIKRKGDRLQ